MKTLGRVEMLELNFDANVWDPCELPSHQELGVSLKTDLNDTLQRHCIFPTVVRCKTRFQPEDYDI